MNIAVRVNKQLCAELLAWLEEETRVQWYGNPVTSHPSIDEMTAIAIENGLFEWMDDTEEHGDGIRYFEKCGYQIVIPEEFKRIAKERWGK
jgi:hypothetical protein